jgi:hypothetical protein
MCTSHIRLISQPCCLLRDLRSPRTTSLDTTRPSTIFYRLLLNWASLRRQPISCFVYVLNNYCHQVTTQLQLILLLWLRNESYVWSAHRVENMNEVEKPEYLSLVSKICTELENHLGLNNKDLVCYTNCWLSNVLLMMGIVNVRNMWSSWNKIQDNLFAPCWIYLYISNYDARNHEPKIASLNFPTSDLNLLVLIKWVNFVIFAYHLHLISGKRCWGQ